MENRLLSLFDPPTRASLLARLDRLTADCPRQWGKMTSAQMFAHCSAALEVANGDTPRRQALIGKLLSWMVRGKLLGPEPLSRNSPTDPSFVITDPRDLATERARLTGEIERFASRGPEIAATRLHTFLGRLSGPEWGVMMGKHLDHHLRQFGV